MKTDAQISIGADTSAASKSISHLANDADTSVRTYWSSVYRRESLFRVGAQRSRGSEQLHRARRQPGERGGIAGSHARGQQRLGDGLANGGSAARGGGVIGDGDVDLQCHGVKTRLCKDKLVALYDFIDTKIDNFVFFRCHFVTFGLYKVKFCN